MRGKPLLWLAAGGALLLAVALLGRSWLLRDRTEPVSVSRVVDRFRAQTTTAPAAALPAGARVPATGVYAYATRGYERADLLGGSRHDYPTTTTIEIVPGGCGYTATWTALDRRREAWTSCALPGAVRPQRFADVHSFYGRTDDRTYACSGGAIPLRADGRPATIVCTRDGVTRTDRVRAVGAEDVAVGDRSVATVHVRTTTRMRGSTEGSGTTDAWLERETGLPVRVVVRIDNRSDTPIGAKVGYVERYELTLKELDPRR